jgi:hypothetical protein
MFQSNAISRTENRPRYYIPPYNRRKRIGSAPIVEITFIIY